MADKLTAQLVGCLYHFTENGIKEILKTLVRAPKSEPTPSVPSISLPWKTWVFYLLVGWVAWYLWPDGKSMPNEIWIGVLSFEGLLAALLAAVAPATVHMAALPFIIRFLGGLDEKMGAKLTDELRQMRDDPMHTGNASAIRNAFIVALNTLFVLPLPLVLSSRWLAVILALSLFWTTLRMIPDLLAFALTEYAPIIPAVYWAARSMHEQLPYCPGCQGHPQSAAWPPPRSVAAPLGLPTTPTQPEVPH